MFYPSVPSSWDRNPPPPPSPRSPPFVPLFRPFPYLPPPPLLCRISARLGRSYCSCLHSAAERAPYTRISPPAVLLWYYFFPPCQLQPHEASSLVTRLLLQQQGQTCTGGIAGASCWGFKLISSNREKPATTVRLQLSKNTAISWGGVGGWVCWIQCHSGEETTGGWLQVVMCSWEKTVDN